uniref:Large ribosomal subunit protein uL22c n=1 Tax=Hemionitis ludens TaxID=377232 RepID=A0A3G5CTK0_HEMLU|nr:ribosomal protein L22 [Calciphilopteris ludens]AYW16026.1 ribosomal protein L22 [Calciphilopteris ludens]
MENKKKSRAQALGKNIRVSVTKMRRIIDRIRNCSYEEALVLPEFMPYRACYPVSQLVLSAAANANANLGMNKSDSFISKAWVDNSTYLRRFRPRAQGRGYPIRRPTCEITIQLSSKFVDRIEIND